jgi:CDGSH-type Zn-finger protein/truncated hemoglobin YjbI/uncharacterized Fe-S cluster protein YjdI
MNEAEASADFAEGEALSVRFDKKLCIHARFCVTQAPDVFRANTPGEWLFPDRMRPEALTAVIRNCPSGALSYETRRPELAEAPPRVNTVRLRENGPYAFNADLRLATEVGPATRRTLCRCGGSRNKPYCDGSHARNGFAATGEPASGGLAELAKRGGPLVVTPLPNGPLEVRGPLEALSGTGRAVARVEACRLCRCGGSQTKPFCDGTHARIGFTDAPGAANEVPVRGVSRPPQPPTLSTWLGGRERLSALTHAFYQRVGSDPLLAPVFAKMSSRHPEHVADFLEEVFGGDPLYSKSGGSHAGMVHKHLGRHLTEAQRKRWLEVMLETADAVGLPADPEFRAALVGYLEWGTRLAVINSQEGVPPPPDNMPIPRWGWGPPGGPWSG